MAAPAFNIVLAGEFGVGKTSIFVRYERNSFLKYTESTFGVDRMTKDVTVDGELHKVRLSAESILDRILDAYLCVWYGLQTKMLILAWVSLSASSIDIDLSW